jgi:hypothetical protein
LADAPEREVRFPPINGHRHISGARPKSATSGRTARLKGGAALTHDKYYGISNTTVAAIGGGVGVGPGGTFSLASETRWGGVIGAGIELGFAP